RRRPCHPRAGSITPQLGSAPGVGTESLVLALGRPSRFGASRIGLLDLLFPCAAGSRELVCARIASISRKELMSRPVSETEARPHEDTDVIPEVAVRLEAVHKRFADVVAVDGVTLDVNQGEFFSVLGPS